MKLIKQVSAAGAALALAGMTSFAWANDRLGQPTPGAIDFQPGVTPLREGALFFHNAVLLPIIAAICLFVLGLLVYCVVRFNKKANPVPARWSHNTPIEVLWTVVPVLILMFIAIFSFKLLFAYHDMPKPAVTVKVTGYQWYWGYEYPDLKVSEITSVMLPENKVTRPDLYRLEADQAMVVPVNENVRVLVTGADVIHAFRVPAFGIMADAIPGRVNQTWFRAEKTGTYYGQCSELCGVDHAFMPINVKVVTRPEFDAWVASKTGAAPAPTPSTLTAQANAGSATNAPVPPAGAPTSPTANQANPPNKTAAPSAGQNPLIPAGPASNPSAPAPGAAQPAPAQH